MWTPREVDAAAKQVYWGTVAFMAMVIGLAHDSMGRDFALLGLLVGICVLAEFRAYVIRTYRIEYGQYRSESSKTK